MKKVLLTLLGIIVVVGILAGAGFAGYRIGYSRAGVTALDETVRLQPRDKTPGLHGMPMHNFGNNFERGFNQMPGHPGFVIMDRGTHGRGFGFMSPFFFLMRIAIWALVIWLIYKVIKGNGWHISITRQSVEAPQATTPAPNEQPSTQADQ